MSKTPRIADRANKPSTKSQPDGGRRPRAKRKSSSYGCSLTFPPPNTPNRTKWLASSFPSAEDIAHIAVDHGPRPALFETKYGLEEMLWCVAVITNLPAAWIKSERRTAVLIRARFAFYFLARKYTGASLSHIGRFCGDRDHSTVLNGLERIDRSFGLYAGLIAKVECLLFARVLRPKTPPQPVIEGTHAYL